MKEHSYIDIALDKRRRRQRLIEKRSAPEIGIGPMPILPGGAAPCP